MNLIRKLNKDKEISLDFLFLDGEVDITKKFSLKWIEGRFMQNRGGNYHFSLFDDSKSALIWKILTRYPKFMIPIKMSSYDTLTPFLREAQGIYISSYYNLIKRLKEGLEER